MLLENFFLYLEKSNLEFANKLPLEGKWNISFNLSRKVKFL